MTETNFMDLLSEWLDLRDDEIDPEDCRPTLVRVAALKRMDELAAEINKRMRRADSKALGGVMC